MNPAPEITPLVKELLVAVPVERAWTAFTAEIDAWWPVTPHSVEPERVREVVLEPRPGGRVFERWHDGTECLWGDVEVWEPPRRVRLSWQPNPEAPAPTEVEVTFSPEGQGTRVRLEHRGWERLGTGAAESRASYDSGWDFVLGRFADGTT